jgi:hypothetical protein
MHVKAYTASSEALLHNLCSSTACKIECIEQVKTDISLFLKELSRVFFKKANMRKKHAWWLSTFYSFCIQSFVKKCLMGIETGASDERRLACEEYLQLPIRLFIATSGTFDPLMSDLGELEVDESEDDRDGQSPNDYKEARIAVGQNKWAADGITGSADYLRSLFGDARPKAQETSNDGPAANNDL